MFRALFGCLHAILTLAHIGANFVGAGITYKVHRTTLGEFLPLHDTIKYLCLQTNLSTNTIKENKCKRVIFEGMNHLLYNVFKVFFTYNNYMELKLNKILFSI